MPADQDKTQKVTFLFQNLYTVYRKGKAAAHAAPSAPSEAPTPSPRLTQEQVDAQIQAISVRPFGAETPGLTTAPVTTGKVIRAFDAHGPIRGPRASAPAMAPTVAPAPSAEPPVAVPPRSTQQLLKGVTLKVEEYRPQVLKSDRAPIPARATEARTVQSLKQNLTQLGDLHARLKFMLEELEDLSKPSK